MKLPFAQHALPLDQDKFLWDLSVAFGTTLDETVEALVYVANSVHNAIIGDMRGALKREMALDDIPHSLYGLMTQTMQQYPENSHLRFLMGLTQVRSKLSATVAQGVPEIVAAVEPEFWERLNLKDRLFVMDNNYHEAQDARKVGLN